MESKWLCSLALNPSRSDLEVHCEGEMGEVVARFPAHSPILCAQSNFFRVMMASELYSEAQTGVITIPGFSPRVIEYFIRFFYTNCIPRLISYDDVLNLLRIAHVYETKNLIVHCCSKLHQDLTLDKLCETYETVKIRNLQNLTQKCESMMITFWKQILRNDLHFSLTHESFVHFLCLLKRRNEVEDSFFLLFAIKRWLNWNSCAHGKTIEELNESFKSWSLQSVRYATPYNTLNDDNSWPYELCLNTYLSDTDIVIHDNETARFPAHSLVIKKHSDFLLAKLRDAKFTEEGKYELCLQHCDPRVAESFLRYLYTRFFPKEMSEKHLLGLFRLACIYKVDELVNKCEKELKSKITVQTCCQVLAATKDLPCKELHKLCTKIAAENLNTVFNNHLHFDLNQVQLISVLRASKYKISTSDEFFVAWGAWQCIVLGLEQDESQISTNVQAVAAAALATCY